MRTWSTAVSIQATPQDTLKYLEDRIERLPWSGCWIWSLNINRGGYAKGKLSRKSVMIHRWAYKILVGDPGILQLDHLCRIRCCVNPAHLEPVTHKENWIRGMAPSAIKTRLRAKEGE